MKKFLFPLFLFSQIAGASFVIPDGAVTQKKLNIQTSSSSDIHNCTVATSVAANALTIAIKTQAGNDPTTLVPCTVSFRNATLTSGTYTQVHVTSALSLVISSGSTLGHTSTATESVYVYLLNNAGTAEVAASTSYFSEGTTQSTTAEGGAGAADSRTVLYSTTARSNVPVRNISRILISEATAGTWASNATTISPVPFTRIMPQGTICSFFFDGSAASPTAPTITNQTCSDGVTTTWIASSTHAATGLYTFTWTTGLMGTTAPNCMGGCGAQAGSDNVIWQFDTVIGVTSATLPVRIVDGGGTEENRTCFVQCMKVTY